MLPEAGRPARRPDGRLLEVDGDRRRQKRWAAVVLDGGEGLAVGDFDKAERAAHSLKGSSGNLGARFVQDVCEKLQLSTRAHELETSRELAPKLSEYYDAAAIALRGVLAQHTN